jgi:serine/threonine protein kinase/WD40 repeat protein
MTRVDPTGELQASRHDEDDALASIVAQLADEFADELDRGGQPDLEQFVGRHPDLEQFVGRHPEIAGVVREVLASVQMVRTSTSKAGSRDALQTIVGPQLFETGVIGDFRLVREIGRGGMGIVYEALQISLGRRVALKVLPFAAALDPRHLQRFQNEAQAAAHLQHPNIVPVYAVSCDRGVHSYAMQFIEGQSLAEVIAELRRLSFPFPGTPGEGQGGGRNLKSQISNSTSENPLSNCPTEYRGRENGPFSRLASAFTTRHSSGAGASAAYVRGVAELAVQAADALDYAHQMGITHRDVKPGNMLLDAHGRLWIADFGLAQARADSQLTATGDLLGTLRYMSPEQALARRGIVDHRTDIYSLGATLYELLTLRPPLDGRDRQELLRKLAEEEPAPASRIDRLIPADLETIVMKTLAKNPAERYATARDLGDDLRRFLADTPIRARRPTPWDRGHKWARRHRPLMFSLAISLALLLVGMTVGAVGYARKQRQLAADRAAFAHSKEVARRQTEQRLYRALFSEAASLELARRPGYRKAVLQRLRDASALDVPGKDLGELQRLVLACLGDPIGLERLERPLALPATRPSLPAFYTSMIAKASEPPAPNLRVTASHDGRSVAFACGGDVCLWTNGTAEGTAGGPVECTKLPLGGCYDLAFTADDALLIAAGETGIAVWAVPSLEPLNVFHDGNVFSIAIHPSRRIFAAIGRQVELWSAASNRVIATYSIPEGAGGFTFSADGQYLLAYGADIRPICGWPVGSTPEKLVLAGHGGGVPAIAFSPEGKRLASAGKDRVVRLWNASSGALLHQSALHDVDIECLAFRPDGSMLATADFAGIIRLWRGGSLSPLFKVKREAGPGQAWRIVFDATGRFMAAAGVAGAVVFELTPNADGSQRFRTFRRIETPNVYDLAIRPGSRDDSPPELAILDKEGLLSRCDLSVPGSCPMPTSLHARVELGNLRFDPTGRTLHFAALDGSIASCDWDTGQILGSSAPGISHPHAAVSPDERWLATAEHADRVLIFDLKENRPALILPPETSEIWSFAWSPDGRRVAVGLSDGGLVIWDLEEVRACLRQFGLVRVEDLRS